MSILRNKKISKHIIIILAITVFFRLLPLFLWGPQIEPDTQNYLQIADILTKTGTFSEIDPVTNELVPYAYRMPLFHLIISGLGKVFGVVNTEYSLVVLNIILSILTVIIGMSIFYIIGSYSLAVCSGYLMSINSNSIYNSVLLLNDTVFSFFSTLMLFVAIIAIKKRSKVFFFLFGILLGLSIMTRPILKYYWLILPILMLTPLFVSKIKEKLQLIVFFLLGVSFLLVPWSCRNFSKVGFFGLDLNQGVNTLWSTKRWVKLSTQEDYKKDPVLAQMRDIVASSKSPFPLEAETKIRKTMDLPMPIISTGLMKIGVETVLKNPVQFGLRFSRNLLNIITSPNSMIETFNLLRGKKHHNFSHLPVAFKNMEWKIILLNMTYRIGLLILFGFCSSFGAILLYRNSHNKFLILIPISIIVYTLFLTSMVEGYDRYRLPLDPILLGFASVWLLQKFNKKSYQDLCVNSLKNKR